MIMAHYHDENDLKLLKDMSTLAPEDFKAWANLDAIVKREDGKIPRKYRELIAIAVAHTTQCVYCIEVFIHRLWRHSWPPGRRGTSVRARAGRGQHAGGHQATRDH